MHYNCKSALKRILTIIKDQQLKWNSNKKINALRNCDMRKNKNRKKNNDIILI